MCINPPNICSEIGIEDCKGIRLTRALQKQRPQLLLLLDEIEKMTWDGFTNQVRGQLRGLANGHDAPLRLVVAASTSLDQLFPDTLQFIPVLTLPINKLKGILVSLSLFAFAGIATNRSRDYNSTSVSSGMPSPTV